MTVACTVESNPPATMTIEYGNMKRLTNTTNNITHTIESVRCSHNGAFNCTTKNSQTRKDTSKIAQLNVLCLYHLIFIHKIFDMTLLNGSRSKSVYQIFTSGSTNQTIVVSRGIYLAFFRCST